MIRTVIIEDNLIVLNVLKKMLNDNFDDIKIIGEASSVKKAITLINEKMPDLVFLDVELPDGNAFNILESFENQTFKVIFTTSHTDYAIKAIKLSALDYIVKPVGKIDLIKAIDKYRNTAPNTENDMLKQSIFIDNIKSQNKSSKIVISTSEEYLIVETNEIVRCQSDSSYTNVFLNNGEKIFVTKTLKEYEEILSDFGFIRVHHSHLVNASYIKSYYRKEGGYLVMKNNEQIPVSRRKKETLIHLLSDINKTS